MPRLAVVSVRMLRSAAEIGELLTTEYSCGFWGYYEGVLETDVNDKYYIEGGVKEQESVLVLKS